MALDDGVVLREEDPKKFRTRRVKVWEELNQMEGGDQLYLSVNGDEIDFSQMTELRKQPVSSETIRNNIFGENKREGHVFANVGVGASIIAKIDGKNYWLGIVQSREQELQGSVVVNHISGYVPIEDLENLLRRVKTEISEELLPVDGEGRIYRFIVDHALIGRPYLDKFEDHGTKIPLEFRETGKYQERCFDYDGLSVHSEKGIGLGDTGRQDKRIFFEPVRNSAKVIYKVTADMSGLDIFGDKISFNSAKEKFNPITRKIEAIYRKGGIVLLGIEKGQLNGSAYELRDGKFKEVDTQNMHLNEAFDIGDNSIVRGNTASILFSDYLEKQRAKSGA